MNLLDRKFREHCVIADVADLRLVDDPSTAGSDGLFNVGLGANALHRIASVPKFDLDHDRADRLSDDVESFLPLLA